MTPIETKPKIPIKNIYLMLCYAWNTLSLADEINVDKTSFENIYNLLSRILYNGVQQLIKRGFHKEYINEKDSLVNLKGKLDISDSIKTQSFLQKKLVCEYDEYSADVHFNQILKYIITRLLKCPEVDTTIRDDLKKISPYFHHIDECPPNKLIRSRLRYNRNNQHYAMLINICVLIYDGLIAEEQGKNIKFSDFIRDKQMAVLFEKFVLNFYIKHLPPEEFRIHSPVIGWDLDYTRQNTGTSMLPTMRTDIVVENKLQNSQLIIDTKFYQSAFSKHFYSELEKIKSNNLYQIYTYMNNSRFCGTISGMLLYPTTTKDFDHKYIIGGKELFIKSLNLNDDWPLIRQRLMDIFKV